MALGRGHRISRLTRDITGSGDHRRRGRRGGVQDEVVDLEALADQAGRLVGVHLERAPGLLGNHGHLRQGCPVRRRGLAQLSRLQIDAAGRELADAQAHLLAGCHVASELACCDVALAGHGLADSRRGEHGVEAVRGGGGAADAGSVGCSARGDRLEGGPSRPPARRAVLEASVGEDVDRLRRAGCANEHDHTGHKRGPHYASRCAHAPMVPALRRNASNLTRKIQNAGQPPLMAAITSTREPGAQRRYRASARSRST